ncbi:hypothetical protein AYB34_01710 [Leptospira sp. ZV016]|nr:hypothetical protein AYB32_00380 [Leptospira kirschneri]KXZ31185.1 hypothetical protein AYB34_01710 [Leptospira sp. ZV016]
METRIKEITRKEFPKDVNHTVRHSLQGYDVSVKLCLKEFSIKLNLYIKPPFLHQLNIYFIRLSKQKPISKKH